MLSSNAGKILSHLRREFGAGPKPSKVDPNNPAGSEIGFVSNYFRTQVRQYMANRCTMWAGSAANRLGVSSSTAMKALRELAGKGYVVEMRRAEPSPGTSWWVPKTFLFTKVHVVPAVKVFLFNPYHSGPAGLVLDRLHDEMLEIIKHESDSLDARDARREAVRMGLMEVLSIAADGSVRGMVKVSTYDYSPSRQPLSEVKVEVSMPFSAAARLLENLKPLEERRLLGRNAARFAS